MDVRTGLTSLANHPPNHPISVGNFDGVHRGHERIFELARSLGATGLACVTFEPHPLTVLRPELAPPRLTPIDVKHRLLAEAGVDYLVELPPTHDVLDVTAERFWQILRDNTRPSHLIEGDNFTFGKGRGGTIERLREWASGSSVKLHVIDPVQIALMDLQVVPISSSLIRWLVAAGRVRDAAVCLGRSYSLRGPVVEGFRRGRTIGVPTANLRITEQLIPAEGVYAGRCAVGGVTYPAAVSIGTMPTFGDNPPQIEAHLVGFSGDLYGQTIDLELVDWVRDQRKFAGVEPLKSQLQTDIARAVELAKFRTAEPIATT
jgi:riboflavin kinase/FMN adenylyltransferase